MIDLILLGVWKSAWIWAPLLGILTAAGIYEWKKGIK